MKSYYPAKHLTIYYKWFGLVYWYLNTFNIYYINTLEQKKTADKNKNTFKLISLLQGWSSHSSWVPGAAGGPADCSSDSNCFFSPFRYIRRLSGSSLEFLAACRRRVARRYSALCRWLFGSMWCLACRSKTHMLLPTSFCQSIKSTTLQMSHLLTVYQNLTEWLFSMFQTEK